MIPKNKQYGKSWREFHAFPYLHIVVESMDSYYYYTKWSIFLLLQLYANGKLKWTRNFIKWKASLGVPFFPAKYIHV